MKICQGHTVGIPALEIYLWNWKQIMLSLNVQCDFYSFFFKVSHSKVRNHISFYYIFYWLKF